MEGKHTPGPWRGDKVRTDGGAPAIRAVNGYRGQDRQIATVLFHGGSEDPEVHANAALIASAPRLAQEHAEMKALLEDWEHACRLVPDIGHLRGKTVALLAKMKQA